MNFRKPSVLILFLIAVINLYFLFAVRVSDNNGNNWQTIIYSDGKGYYEYLRAVFINHNLSQPDSSKGFIRNTENGKAIKFFAGTAVAQLPFFLLAQLVSVIRNHETDGYSFEFQLLIALAGYFYLLIGLIWLRKFLLQLSIKEEIIAITFLLIAYGTNLFYYSIFEPSMSHVYAFAFTSIFIFEIFRYCKTYRPRYLIVASIALGITILIRPTNAVIVLMIPAFCSDWKALLQFLKNYRHVLISVLIVLILVFIQPVLWKIQTGSWLIWSYSGEGFYFLNPSVKNVLFSFNKGWFIYTPLAFISIAGVISIWKENKPLAISLLLTLSAAIYVTSSWWCWNYGDSFGMRPLIDFYPLIAILLAALLSSFQKLSIKIAAGFFLTAFLVLSCVQTYQYYEKILQHYSMNEGKYRYIFLKTDNSYKNILGGNIDLRPYSKEDPVLLYETNNDFEKVSQNWNPPNFFNDPITESNKCCLFDSTFAHLVYEISDDTSIRNSDMLWIEISLKRMELSKHSSQSAQFIGTVKNDDEIIFTYQFALNDYPDLNTNQWRNYHYAFWIRKPSKPIDVLSLAVENSGDGKFLVDDVEIKIYGIIAE